MRFQTHQIWFPPMWSVSRLVEYPTTNLNLGTFLCTLSNRLGEWRWDGKLMLSDVRGAKEVVDVTHDVCTSKFAKPGL